MVHWPKLALQHAVPVPSRMAPLWLPFALALISLGAAALAAQLAIGQPLMFGSSDAPAASAETFVMRFVNDWSPERDPLVTVRSGAHAKTSNVYGVEYQGTRYYYQLTRQASFDPLRLGSIRDYEVIALLDAGTPWEVMIYKAK